MKDDDDWDDTKIDPNAFNFGGIELGDFIIKEEKDRPFRRKPSGSVKRYSLRKGSDSENTQLAAIETALKEIDFRYGVEDELEGRPTVVFSYGDPSGENVTDIDVKFITDISERRSTILCRYHMDFKNINEQPILKAVNYANPRVVKGKFFYDKTFDDSNTSRKSVLFSIGDFFGIRSMNKDNALEMIALACSTTEQYSEFFDAIRNGKTLASAKLKIKRD